MAPTKEKHSAASCYCNGLSYRGIRILAFSLVAFFVNPGIITIFAQKYKDFTNTIILSRPKGNLDSSLLNFIQ